MTDHGKEKEDAAPTLGRSSVMHFAARSPYGLINGADRTTPTAPAKALSEVQKLCAEASIRY